MTVSARRRTQALFRDRTISKQYEAIAPWLPGHGFPIVRKSRIVQDEPFFRQCEIAGEPNSETCMDVIEKLGDLARYALSPVTGKEHQLRVHMNALGVPILNDRMYPPVSPTPGDDYSLPLQLLAKSIAFTDPLTGQARRFESGFKLQH